MKKTSGTDREWNARPMGHYTQGVGSMTKPQGWEDSFRAMVEFTKESSRMIRDMEKDSREGRMEVSTLETGHLIMNRDMAKRVGQTGKSTTGPLRMARNQEEGCSQ